MGKVTIASALHIIVQFGHMLKIMTLLQYHALKIYKLHIYKLNAHVPSYACISRAYIDQHAPVELRCAWHNNHARHV